MAQRSYYIGCRQANYYEVGHDPHFFEKGLGFAWKYFLCELDTKFVEKVMKLDMIPGELRRIKLGSMKTTPLTEEEWRRIQEWKKGRSSTAPQTRK